MRISIVLGRGGLALLAVLGGCRGVERGEAAELGEPAIVRRASARQEPAAALASQEQSPFIAHPDHIQPGLTLAQALRTLVNPFEGDPKRKKEGESLFVSYNCADCHGAGGSGAMGPSLADNRWHFGGTAGEVYQSIYEGRPDGMPAWGGRISDQQIWALVSYVRSLGAGKDLSTENFTGKTIETMGH